MRYSLLIFIIVVVVVFAYKVCWLKLFYFYVSKIELRQVQVILFFLLLYMWFITGCLTKTTKLFYIKKKKKKRKNKFSKQLGELARHALVLSRPR